ncbi:hypothetical protein BH23ACT9_BH23ACT9_14340 [soil metagenome]
MAPARSRRMFLTDLGRSTAGLVVVGLGLSACDHAGDPTAVRPEGLTPAADIPSGPRSPSEVGDGLPVGTVDLGFVAAYVVQRDGQAVVIDTGVADSEQAILDVLSSMGLAWSDVSDVVLTHSHPDHAGSLSAVADAAPDATMWGGEDDIPQMQAPRQIQVLADGDMVMDLRTIATPGHTPGHLSMFHPGTGTLFSGDALNGRDGTVIGPNPDFTPDMTKAMASVATLAVLEPATIHVCHGFPVSSGAADLTALAAT